MAIFDIQILPKLSGKCILELQNCTKVTTCKNSSLALTSHFERFWSTVHTSLLNEMPICLISKYGWVGYIAEWVSDAEDYIELLVVMQRQANMILQC